VQTSDHAALITIPYLVAAVWSCTTSTGRQLGEEAIGTTKVGHTVSALLRTGDALTCSIYKQDKIRSEKQE
jgi:hypothetical protein